jgi:hypothetical protein
MGPARHLNSQHCDGTEKLVLTLLLASAVAGKLTTSSASFM